MKRYQLPSRSMTKGDSVGPPNVPLAGCWNATCFSDQFTRSSLVRYATWWLPPDGVEFAV